MPYVDEIRAAPVRPYHVCIAVAMPTAFIACGYYSGAFAATKSLLLAMMTALVGVWIHLLARVVVTLRGKPLRTAFGDIAPKRQPKLFAILGVVSFLPPPAMGALVFHIAYNMGIHLLRWPP